MKSTVAIKFRKENTFPGLYVVEEHENAGMIVLMDSRGEGIVVHSPDGCYHAMGTYASNWAMDCFEPFEGKVTIES